MSRFATYPTQFKDKECLKAALADEGYTIVEDHETAQQLFDWHGRATTYLDKTGDKANIIVRRQYVGGAANDLGFKKNADGKYEAIISAYDSGKHNTQWMDGLTKNYSEKVIRKESNRFGLKPHSTQVMGGKKIIKYLIA